MSEQNQTQNTKILQIHLDPELHRRFRILVSRRATTARAIVTRLIEEELKRDKESPESSWLRGREGLRPRNG